MRDQARWTRRKMAGMAIKGFIVAFCGSSSKCSEVVEVAVVQLKLKGR